MDDGRLSDLEDTAEDESVATNEHSQTHSGYLLITKHSSRMHEAVVRLRYHTSTRDMIMRSLLNSDLLQMWMLSYLQGASLLGMEKSLLANVRSRVMIPSLPQSDSNVGVRAIGQPISST